MQSLSNLANVYRMPEGDWGAYGVGVCSDGFETRKQALEWIVVQLSHVLEIVVEKDPHVLD